MKRLAAGLALLVLVGTASLLGPRLSPYDPIAPDYRARYVGASETHPLGTDGLGRDVLTRSIAGGRVSLGIAISATLLTVLVGALFGTAAAGLGGAFELASVRLFDAVLAFPGFLLVLLAVAILGGGAWQTVLALAVAGSPLYFRLARAYTRAALKQDYVMAGRALGARQARLLGRHVVPNFLGPLAVQSASTAATFLLVEASLSYLGLGVPLPTPTWGNVLQDARSYLTRQPWAAIGPGVMLGLAALSLQLTADGARDVLDRRSR